MEQTQTGAPDVVVTVGADNKPVCTPHTVRPQGSNVVLKFEVQTAGYAFPANGAVVVTDGGAQFPEPSQTIGPNDTVALLRDVNSNTGSYRYTVAVQRIADGEVLRVDPTIQNGD